MANWVDLVIVIIFGLAVTLEVRRGFGRAVFDLAALLAATRLAPILAGMLSGSIRISGDSNTNEAIVYALAFVVIGGILMFLGKLVYDTTLISAETFDALLGGVCGMGVGVVLSHVFVRTIALDMGLDVPSEALHSSMLGIEFLTFDSYHRVLDTLYNIGE